MKSLGRGVFAECTALTSIVVPGDIETIENMTFYRCTALTSVTIPKSVTKICTKAFQKCSSLTDIYYTGTEEEWNAIEKEELWDKETGAYTVHFNHASNTP